MWTQCATWAPTMTPPTRHRFALAVLIRGPPGAGKSTIAAEGRRAVLTRALHLKVDDLREIMVNGFETTDAASGPTAAERQIRRARLAATAIAVAAPRRRCDPRDRRRLRPAPLRGSLPRSLHRPGRAAGDAEADPAGARGSSPRCRGSTASQALQISELTAHRGRVARNGRARLPHSSTAQSRGAVHRPCRRSVGNAPPQGTRPATAVRNRQGGARVRLRRQPRPGAPLTRARARFRRDPHASVDEVAHTLVRTERCEHPISLGAAKLSTFTGGSTLVGQLLPTAWKRSFQLDLQRKAQEGSNRHDERKDGCVSTGAVVRVVRTSPLQDDRGEGATHLSEDPPRAPCSSGDRPEDDPPLRTVS